MTQVKIGEELHVNELLVALQTAPVNELPGLPFENALSYVTKVVESGSLLVIFNKHANSRWFFNGALPENLDEIRVVAFHASTVPGIVDDGEWNWYIQKDLGAEVEIHDHDLIHNILMPYVNDALQHKNKENVHHLRS
jgi:hypothetical protein